MAKKTTLVRKSAVARKAAAKKAPAKQATTRKPRATPLLLARRAAKALAKAKKQFGAAQLQADKLVARAHKGLMKAQKLVDKHPEPTGA